MVMIKYNGQNPIIFGKYQIKTGSTEIKDDDFYNLMKSKSFSSRVHSKVFGVPVDFPLEKKEEESKQHYEDVKPTNENREEEQNPSQLKVKEVLIIIDECCDVDFLNNLMESDSRDKVKEHAHKRIKHLKHNK